MSFRSNRSILVFRIDDETAKLVSNIIKDGIEKIDLSFCRLTKQGITIIAEKITKSTNSVNIFIFYRM